MSGRTEIIKNQIVLFLACAWPMTNFATHNAQYLEGAWLGFLLIGLIFLGVFALTFLVFWFLKRIFGNRNTIRLVLAACSVIVIFFSYQQLMSFWNYIFNVANISLPPHFGYAFTVLTSPLVVFAFGNNHLLRDIVLAFLFVVVLASFAELIWVISKQQDVQDPNFTPIRVSEFSKPEEREEHTTQEASLRGKITQLDNAPNIYHIVVDGYARSDQLASVLSFNNSPFISALEDRGFTVIDNARANYPYTAFSLSSMFSMDYIYTEKDRFTGFKFTYEILGGVNPVISSALQLGYRFVHIGSNLWGGTECPSSPKIYCLTPNISTFSNRNLEILNAINRMTPLSYFLTIGAKMGDVTNVDHVRELAESLTIQLPFLFFAHTMPPHAPYMNRSDCTQQDSIQFNLSGGPDPKKYVDSLRCVNKRLLSFVNFIEEKDSNAIVIISSDHGSKFLLEETIDLDKWTKEQFNERYSILLAIRGAEKCSATLFSNLTLVNLYRYVFSCVTKTEPNYLRNYFYNVNYGISDPNDKSAGEIYKFPTEHVDEWGKQFLDQGK